MMTDSIYDALEICLQALDGGADLESCLARYPELANDLRPLLVAAAQARAVAVTDVPVDLARRGKARVLQAAAEMREQRSTAPALPFWRRKSIFGPRVYRLALTTTMVVIFLLTGGTGLVNASNGALPGDKLYPVKRGWEGVRLAFVFDHKAKAELENEFEHERKIEIEELYSEKRFEQVSFEGVVEVQQPGLWQISGLAVAVESETVYSGEILPGAFVQIIGETDDGIIKAKQIILLATPGVTPTSLSPATLQPIIIQGITPEGENEQEMKTPENGGSGETERIETPEPTEKPASTEKPEGGGESGYSTPEPEHHKSDTGSGDGGDSNPPSSETESSGGDN